MKNTLAIYKDGIFRVEPVRHLDNITSVSIERETILLSHRETRLLIQTLEDILGKSDQDKRLKLLKTQRENLDAEIRRIEGGA